MSTIIENNALENEAKEAEIDRQQDIFSEIDILKNESYEVSETILNDIMPEAFAVVKETATRFVNNDEHKKQEKICCKRLNQNHQEK